MPHTDGGFFDSRETEVSLGSLLTDVIYRVEGCLWRLIGALVLFILITIWHSHTESLFSSWAYGLSYLPIIIAVWKIHRVLKSRPEPPFPG